MERLTDDSAADIEFAAELGLAGQFFPRFHFTALNAEL